MRRSLPKGETQGSVEAFPVLFPFGAPMVDLFVRSGEACTRACLDWQDRLVQFASDRLEADAHYSASMARCRSFGDLQKLQQEWAGSAMRAYLDETARLMEIAGRAAREGMIPPGSEVGPGPAPGRTSEAA